VINDKFVVPHVYEHPGYFDIFLAFVGPVNTGFRTKKNADRQDREKEGAPHWWNTM
jgi:hypothetical protein